MQRALGEYDIKITAKIENTKYKLTTALKVEQFSI